MKENVLDVLMYLFETYYMDEDTEPSPDRETLHTQLLEAGFHRTDIEHALGWLEGLADASRENGRHEAPLASSLRVFTGQEIEKLDLECRGFLLYLEQNRILTPPAREIVIDRVMALQTEEIDIEQLKWVILMVLFNQPGQEEAYAWMEELVFDHPAGYLH